MTTIPSGDRHPTPRHPADKMPVNPTDFPGYGTQINLTFATIPLTLAGGNLQKVVKADTRPCGPG